MVCPWLKNFEKLIDPLKNHLKGEGGDHQIEVLEPQRRQPHDGAENSTHTAGE